MLLFFYIIIALVILIALFILLIVISKIELKIHNLHINSALTVKNNEDLLIQISLKILNIRWIKIKLSRTKIEKLKNKIKEEEKRLNLNEKEINKKIKNKINKAIKDKEIRENILNTKVELEEFKSKLEVATDDYIITSYLVAIISIIISNIIPHIISKKTEKKLGKKIQYYVTPVYKVQNSYSLRLDTTVSTKLLHLLYIAVKIIKKNNIKIKKFLYKKGRNSSY